MMVVNPASDPEFVICNGNDLFDVQPWDEQTREFDLDVEDIAWWDEDEIWDLAEPATGFAFVEKPDDWQWTFPSNSMVWHADTMTSSDVGWSSYPSSTAVDPNMVIPPHGATVV